MLIVGKTDDTRVKGVCNAQERSLNNVYMPMDNISKSISEFMGITPEVQWRNKMVDEYEKHRLKRTPSQERRLQEHIGRKKAEEAAKKAGW
jgi:hypothetical protein